MQTLNDTFNIEPVKEVEGDLILNNGEVVVPDQGGVDGNIDYDYERTRGNLHSLLSQGQEALAAALNIAKESEHPRAFEVVGNLVKQLADVNHQLLDLSEKRQKLKDKSIKEDAPGSRVTNNNAFFVGSTTELNKMIKKMTGDE
jgi:hypothetical protein